MNILYNSNTSISCIPFSASLIAAGFPSPAEEYLEAQLDLNTYLVSSPSSTFFARIDTNTALVGSVKKGSILIVDKSIIPTNNKIVVAVCDGKFLLRRVKLNAGKQVLVTDNIHERPITINEDSYIWGVVKSIITKL